MSAKQKVSHRSAGEAFSSDLEDLGDSFNQIRSETKKLVKHAVDSGHSGVSAVREKAVQGVQRGISNLKDMGNDSIESFGERISQRPYTSTMIALGVGFLLAQWMRRR
jgi:ElaB/YqjD/DUF883 family membrane-anchored ribosome-binding protein